MNHASWYQVLKAKAALVGRDRREPVMLGWPRRPSEPRRQRGDGPGSQHRGREGTSDFKK